MTAAGLILLRSTLALDNGEAPTPPMGWRSWNQFHGDITSSLMEEQFDALVSSGLAALGYVHAGIDDGWQACDSYTVTPSNSPAFHDAHGVPIVNATKFPDTSLKSMVAHGTTKGLKVGWYANNCICHESGGHIRNETWRNLSYAGDVAQLVDAGFRGVKFDNCGLHNDMDYYTQLMNATGKTWMVERSDQGHGTPTNLTWCPYNMFRSSGDIRNTWNSLYHNLHTVTQYANLSRPNCWAYPDMLQVGRLAGPLAAVESRTHFGAWCIVSSPLILGFDLTNKTVLNDVLPYVANKEAIAVNQAYVGDPGRLLQQKDSSQGGYEIWTKKVSTNSTAFLAINTDPKVNATAVTIDDVLFDGCSVRDVWAHADRHVAHGVTSLSFGNIAPHDSVFLIVTCTPTSPVFAATPATSSRVAAASRFALPPFSWDVIPRFVHCGPKAIASKPNQTVIPIAEVYRKMATFPMATLEKFTLQESSPANVHEEMKILDAAREIRAHNTSTKIIFYHMAWQDFSQFDLFNTSLAHATEHWLLSWDNGSIPGIDVVGKPTYNLSNAAMRGAWVGGLKAALDTGLIDGFFIDITPQALPNISDAVDRNDATVNYAKNINALCLYCSAARKAELLDGLVLALQELALACPSAIIICNPADLGACNTQFMEFFGSSADHGRSVLGDFELLSGKWEATGHIVQARAASFNSSTVFHVAEFLIGVGPYTYLGVSHSPGWGCDDGWLDTGVPGDPELFARPLGAPLAPYTRTPNGAVPIPHKHNATGTGGWIYTRSFAKNTHVWLNLTDADGWDHARKCVAAKAPWPMRPTCPQLCIWWGDGALTKWPPGFGDHGECNKTKLMRHEHVSS